MIREKKTTVKGKLVEREGRKAMSLNTILVHDCQVTRFCSRSHGK